MNITVNNNPRCIADGSTLASILADYPEGGTATAVNGRFVARDVRESTILNEGDEVVIISAAYGG